MNWKMFGQVILLIIIAAVILTAVKAMKYRVCGIRGSKYMSAAPKYSQNFESVTSAQK